MKLELADFIVYKSDKENKCDATELFFGNNDRKEICFTHGEVAALFYARFGKIYKNDDAVFIQVLDTETGELLEMNCRLSMHNLMMKYLLYPPIIQKIFA